MNFSSIASNDSSEYELNADTLDQLYKEQLHRLRDLVFNQNNTTDIELCRKWLKVFSKTTKAEKVARNCLSALMQLQLQEFGSLSSPFTDLQNCNRDLEQVLRELDEQTLYSCEMMSVSREIYSSHVECGPSTMASRTMESAADGESKVLMECQHNEIYTENCRLRKELETMRLQLTEKQIENAKCKMEMSAKCQMQTTKSMETAEEFKKKLLKCMENTLIGLQNTENLKQPLKLFENIFKEQQQKQQQDDVEFITSIQKCDEILQNCLTKLIENEIGQRKDEIAHDVSQKLTKSKARLRKKYDKRFRIQTWAQRLQLKLVKLKCFSVLRQIFINSQSDEDAIWKMLKLLEEKYESIVSEII